MKFTELYIAATLYIASLAGVLLVCVAPVIVFIATGSLGWLVFLVISIPLGLTIGMKIQEIVSKE